MGNLGGALKHSDVFGTSRPKSKKTSAQILKILPQSQADYYRVLLQRHKKVFKGTEDKMTQAMSVQFIDRIEKGQSPPDRIVKAFIDKVENMLKRYMLGKFKDFRFNQA